MKLLTLIMLIDTAKSELFMSPVTKEKCFIYILSFKNTEKLKSKVSLASLCKLVLMTHDKGPNTLSSAWHMC